MTTPTPPMHTIWARCHGCGEYVPNVRGKPELIKVGDHYYGGCCAFDASCVETQARNPEFYAFLVSQGFPPIERATQ